MIASLPYYQSHGRGALDVAMDRGLLKALFLSSSPVSPSSAVQSLNGIGTTKSTTKNTNENEISTKNEVREGDLQIGDLVECVSRLTTDGSMLPHFGVVVALPEQAAGAGAVAQVYTVAGQKTTISREEIRFRIPCILNRGLLELAFDNSSILNTANNTANNANYDSTQYDLDHIKSHVLIALKLVVKATLESIIKLEPALIAVHAQSAVSAGTGVPQLLPLDIIATRAVSIARVSRHTSNTTTGAATNGTATTNANNTTHDDTDTTKHQKTASTLIKSAASVLATHIWLTNNPIYWWTLPPNAQPTATAIAGDRLRGLEWIAYPAEAAEEAQYVVEELDDADYREFGVYLRQRCDSNDTNKEHDNDEEHDFSALIGFLKRFIIYPHRTFHGPVAAILAAAYPHHDHNHDHAHISPDRYPARVHELLIRAGLTMSDYPMLDSELVYKVTEKQGIVDKYSGAAATLAELPSGSATEDPTTTTTTTADTTSRHITLPNHITVYAFTSYNDQTPKLAISLDQSRAHQWTLSIHVPDVSAHYAPHSAVMAMALRRVRSAVFPDGVCEMLPQVAVDNICGSFFGRGSGGESDDKSASASTTKCISFSVKFSPWKPTEWGVNDIQVELTEVSNVVVLPVEQVEDPMVGWSRRNISPMSPVFEQEHEHEHDHDLVARTDDGHLEPLEQLELGGDLGDSGGDFQESAMGGGSSRQRGSLSSSAQTNPIDNDELDSPTSTRLSLFSNQLSRTDRNNLAAIKETLHQNFWKRMDAGAAYESVREATLPIASIQLGLMRDEEDHHQDIQQQQQQRQKGEQQDQQLQQKFRQFVKSLDVSPRAPFDQRLVTEAEIVAGEVCALWGSKVGLALPYEGQSLLLSSSSSLSSTSASTSTSTSTPTSTSATLKSLLTQTRTRHGSLSASGRHVAQHEYLQPPLLGVQPRVPHFGLGVAAGYVGVARATEDIRHVVAVWQVVSVLARGGRKSGRKSGTGSRGSSGSRGTEEKERERKSKSWPTLSGSELSNLLTTTIIPRESLLSALERASVRYWTLRWLEQELSRSGMGYFVFKCIISSDVMSVSNVVKGFCVELGMEVDIVVQGQVMVARADRVMCTEVVDLDPTTGILVLGM